MRPILAQGLPAGLGSWATAVRVDLQRWRQRFQHQSYAAGEAQSVISLPRCSPLGRAARRHQRVSDLVTERRRCPKRIEIGGMAGPQYAAQRPDGECINRDAGKQEPPQKSSLACCAATSAPIYTLSVSFASMPPLTNPAVY